MSIAHNVHLASLVMSFPFAVKGESSEKPSVDQLAAQIQEQLDNGTLPRLVPQAFEVRVHQADQPPQGFQAQVALVVSDVCACTCDLHHLPGLLGQTGVLYVAFIDDCI